MGKNNHFSGVTVDVVFVALSVCCLVLLSSFFVYCTIPESMEACFLVVLGGGGGGVLLGRGGGNCCEQTKRERETPLLFVCFVKETETCFPAKGLTTFHCVPVCKSFFFYQSTNCMTTKFLPSPTAAL